MHIKCCPIEPVLKLTCGTRKPLWLVPRGSLSGSHRSLMFFWCKRGLLFFHIVLLGGPQAGAPWTVTSRCRRRSWRTAWRVSRHRFLRSVVSPRCRPHKRNRTRNQTQADSPHFWATLFR